MDEARHRLENGDVVVKEKDDLDISKEGNEDWEAGMKRYEEEG